MIFTVTIHRLNTRKESKKTTSKDTVSRSTVDSFIEEHNAQPMEYKMQPNVNYYSISVK